MTGGPVLSVVVPVYNEKPNILPTAEGVLEAFGALASQTEVLFVDDTSPDGTAEEVVRVSRSLPQIRLVQHGKKEGMGAAHHAGYQAARGEYVMCIDADLSQSPSDLIRMKAKIDSGYDLVVGSRYVSGGKQIGKSFLRDWGSRGMNLMASFCLGIPIYDATHTFRVFKRSLYEAIASKLDQKGHPSFPIQFTFWAKQKGFRMTEIPITFVEREAGRGESKVSVRRELIPFLKLLLRLFVARWRHV